MKTARKTVTAEQKKAALLAMAASTSLPAWATDLWKSREAKGAR